MKLKYCFAHLLIAVAVFIVYSQINRRPFAPAEDFPRDALVYVQTADLPALIKFWNESEFKEKYLESENFKDFADRHLGRKLASRWHEFNDAAGFSIDLETVSSLAGNQAAIAFYDVGKLEFVFIAPVSDEIFAATKFAQNRERFAEETLADDTLIYRVNVEADHGRQIQELIFTQIKGRLVIATSENLLVQTLGNINGKQSKNRLIDEPSFKALSGKIEPHSATVWLDQKALNDDYYFKHYWLMSDVENLDNIRAGMFDFEIQADKFIERRKFLLDKPAENLPDINSAAEEMTAFLPADVPFYRLQTANQNVVNAAVEKTIFAQRQKLNVKSRNYSNFSTFDDYSSGDYETLGEKYDEAIDDTDDDETVERREIGIDFSQLLQTAIPQAVLTFSVPKMLPAPLFIEFQRAAVIHLASPQTFDREKFETAISQKLADRILISAPGVILKWATNSENFRELNLPKLGWSVNYALAGHDLIVSSDGEFLRQILSEPRTPKIEKQNSPVSSLIIINLSERENAYDKIFDEMAGNAQGEYFFTDNISSLLDSISQIKRIEIREKITQNIFDEEITFILRDPTK